MDIKTGRADSGVDNENKNCAESSRIRCADASRCYRSCQHFPVAMVANGSTVAPLHVDVDNSVRLKSPGDAASNLLFQ